MSQCPPEWRVTKLEAGKAAKIERCHMLGLDGLPVSPCEVIIIRQGRTAGPATKKCQGTLGCGKTLRIADLPDLWSAAFVRGGLEPAQPVQKTVVA